MKQELVLTADGSTSIFIEELDEHYHSIHGALQESKHVFINAGLQQKCQQNDTISILEIGFGTGLNALLTCIENDKLKKHINYVAIEKFPLPENIYKQLNYCSLIDNDNCSNIFDKLHHCTWMQPTMINNNFQLTKIQQDFNEVHVKDEFDIIYFDAFAPSAQPELWTETIFKSMYEALKTNGILVTYCAKGLVKRTMKNVGFTVESLPGPVGKREMTRARK